VQPPVRAPQRPAGAGGSTTSASWASPGSCSPHSWPRRGTPRRRWPQLSTPRAADCRGRGPPRIQPGSRAVAQGPVSGRGGGKGERRPCRGRVRPAGRGTRPRGRRTTRSG
jgi:hypothetical protein